MSEYECKLDLIRCDNFSFGVLFNPVERFPTDDKINPIIHQPLVNLVCAIDDVNGWAFLHFNNDMRKCIYDEMISKEVLIGRWYWCNLYNVEYGEITNDFFDFD